MPPNAPLPKATAPVDAKKFVTVVSGWNHLTGVLANDAARNLAKSQHARRGIRQLINRGA